MDCASFNLVITDHFHIHMTSKTNAISRICELYVQLSTDCQSELIGFSKIISPAKNSILVREGQLSDKSYFILRGCARAYYLKDGKDISDWFAFEDEFISSIQSFFLDIPSPHFIEVMEDSVLLEIPRHATQKLSEKYCEFERLIKEIAIRTMLLQQERIVALQFQSAEQKYRSLLQKRSDITLRIPLKHIASYIGITLETLSRIRSSNLI